MLIIFGLSVLGVTTHESNNDSLHASKSHGFPQLSWTSLGHTSRNQLCLAPCWYLDMSSRSWSIRVKMKVSLTWKYKGAQLLKVRKVAFVEYTDWSILIE